jgi:hypothetical protein
VRAAAFVLLVLSPGAVVADDAAVRRILGTFPDDRGTGGCGSTRARPVPGRTSEGLSLNVFLDEGESVLEPRRDGDEDSVPTLAINVVLTNRTRRTRHLSFPESCMFEYVVRGPGGRVVEPRDLTFGCLGALHSVRVRPGERTVERVHWTGRRAPGEPLPPGAYSIAGVLRKRWCGGEPQPPARSRPAVVRLLPAR